MGVRDVGDEAGPVRGALTRRTLLAGGAVLLAGCNSKSPAKGTPAAKVDPRDWASVKASFGLDPKLRHFTAFLLASHAAPVRAAIERHRAELDRNPASSAATSSIPCA